MNKRGNEFFIGLERGGIWFYQGLLLISLLEYAIMLIYKMGL
jgi:hypothetical protein